jgi:uncharacterized protein (DUF433 family)
MKSFPRISKTPGVCGGDACIRKTRIPVWTLVEYRSLGSSDQELLEIYPGLTPPDIQAAWEYYESNRDEIETAIRENDEAAWQSLYSTTSRPFDRPKTGKIAVKVINHYGDEVLKVYEV